VTDTVVIKGQSAPPAAGRASYDWQLARLKAIADASPDVYVLSESKRPDVLGLPALRSAYLWTMCETSEEAFTVGKAFLQEYALYGFDVSIRECIGQWCCTLQCVERLS
jgi:hypothetical protein